MLPAASSSLHREQAVAGALWATTWDSTKKTAEAFLLNHSSRSKWRNPGETEGEEKEKETGSVFVQVWTHQATPGDIGITLVLFKNSKLICCDLFATCSWFMGMSYVWIH